MPELTWIGKEHVIAHHLEVPYRVLEHRWSFDAAAGRQAAEGDSGNMIIRGDNLHALKSLLPRYAGRVKCIYIDPPYNTGNEGWVYNDNMNAPQIKKWFHEVVGKEGEDLSRHDKWLCMMYPRLKLLRQFLREDGVIFVSIDDDEVHHLRVLMDDLFGARERLATFVWRTDGNFDNQAKIKNCHEYVLAYARNPDLFPHPSVVDPAVGKGSKLNRSHIRNTIVKNGPKNPVSSIVLPAGFPASINTGVIRARTDQWPHYATDVNIVAGKLASPVTVSSGWSSKSILQSFIDSNFESVLDSKGQRTRFVVTGTGAIESIKEREQASHVISVIGGVGSTQSQSAELSGMGFVFPFPKPVDLIRYLISMIQGDDFIVLDSFGGSGTTAHAVLKLNAEDGGNRKFILVEMEDYAESLTAECVQRVIAGYGEGKNAVPGTGGGFSFYDLGERLLLENGNLNEAVGAARIREYVWHRETKLPAMPDCASVHPYLLGVHNGAAYWFYYEPGRQTELNMAFLATLPRLPEAPERHIIYADAHAFGDEQLERWGIEFKKIPRDIPKL